jgi:hypothetical protein
MSKSLNIFSSLCLFSLLIAGYFFNLKLSAALYLSLSIFLTFFAVISPSFAIFLFLFALPIFGNKPGTSQEAMLIVIGLALQLGLNLRFLSLKFLDNQKILSSCYIYLFISFLSLFPVSFTTGFDWLRSSLLSPTASILSLDLNGALADLSLLSLNISAALFGHEDHLAYPIKSVLLTALTVSLSYSIFRLSKFDSSKRIYFCVSILAGFLLSLVVGLVDFYGFIDLRIFREFDPVVNPEKVALRLQSWFGHSGWYAEYLTMVAPFVMLFLAISTSFWTRTALVVLCLLLAEFVLILTFQRGGWLSYPISLIAVWCAVYLIYMREKGEISKLKALKSSLIKIIVSIPLTLLISLCALSFFGSNLGIDQYTSRLKDISKASDRMEFVEAGYKIGLLNPILGQGSESFALQYKREYMQADGKYYGQLNLPLHGTAHGLYAQTFAGKGLLGLLALILVIFTSVNHGFRFSISRECNNSKDQVVSLACVCSLIAITIYGFVQEVFYVLSLQYLFFCVVGIVCSFNYQNTSKKLISTRTLTFLIILLFILHLTTARLTAREHADPFGCYPQETSADQSWTWCGIRSQQYFKRSDLGILKLQMAPGESEPNALLIKVCDKELYNQVLRAGQNIEVDLSPAREINCGNSPQDFIKVEASTAHYFVPAISSSDSKDARVLSFRWFLN